MNQPTLTPPPSSANKAPSYSRRFTLENLDIRGQFVRLGDVWQQLLANRQLRSHEISFLGEFACVAVLVGAGLKHEGRATLQIQRRQSAGSEPAETGVRLLVVDCTNQLGVRGMLQSHGDTAQSFAEWVGNATLALTVSNNENGQQYQSIVPVSGLSVAECFEHYFDQSEQLPTHLWIAASAEGAGALLLQKLPGADAKDADGWARVEQLAASVKAEELIAAPIDVLLRHLFAEEDIRLFEPKSVISACKRDEDKVKNMLRSLGRAELEATLAEHGEVVVNDDLCNESYRFGPEQVARLFDV